MEISNVHWEYSFFGDHYGRFVYFFPILRNFDVLYLNPNKIKNELVFSEKEIKEGFEIWKDEFSSQEKRLLKQVRM